jgi:flagellar basal-body rod modification protein FlgD
MDINTISNSQQNSKNMIGDNKSILGKDDFLKLLLVELQNQDPTKPQDSDKILQQTSDLASLEASTNTNKSLENLSKSMAISSQFSAISTIGKMADMGTDSISLEQGKSVDFGVYFPEDVQSGQIEIQNNQGITIDTIDIKGLDKGTTNFDWDGKDKNGASFKEGYYKIKISYSNYDGESKNGKFGIYPIEAVKFNGSQAEVRLGTSYIPLSSVKEIYNP